MQLNFKKIVPNCVIPSIGLLAALAFFIGLVTIVNAQPSQTVLPIENIRNMSLSSSGSIMVTLHEDDTLSVYDVVQEEFRSERIRPVADAAEVYDVIAGTGSTTFAIIYRSSSENTARLAILRLKNQSINESEQVDILSDYHLGPHQVRGIIQAEFSPDGDSLYVLYADDSLFVLPIEGGERQRISVGEIPIDMEFGNSGDLFVVNEHSEELSIVDTQTFELKNTIRLGESPRKVIFNPINQLIYVTHVGSDDVYIINPKDGEVVEVVYVGGDPSEAVYDSRSGNVYVGNNTSGQISLIKPAFGVEYIDINSAAYFKSAEIDLVLNEHSGDLYILNTSESKYLVVDLESRAVVKVEETESFPVEMYTSKGSEDVFFWHWGSNSVGRINSETYMYDYISDTSTENQVFFSKPQSVTVDRETHRVFVSNLGSNYVTVIDGRTQKVLGTIVVGRTVQNLFIDSKVRTLYAVSPSDDMVVAINIDDEGYPLTEIQLSQQSRGGVINETTNKIYYSNAAVSTISVVDSKINEVTKEIALLPDSFPLVSSVDERRNQVYVALYGAGQIAVIDGSNDAIQGYIEVGENPIWVRFIEELDVIFAAVEGAGEILIIDPEQHTNIQVIRLSGEPYRIFFDTETEYVYVNRRNENLVSIIALNEETISYEVIEERPIDYWGETDARPYNMVSYDEGLGLAYFTAGKANAVDIVRVDRDYAGFIYGVHVATIDATGSTMFTGVSTSTDMSSETMSESWLDAVVNRTVLAGALLLVLLTGTVWYVIWFVYKRTKKNHT